MEAWPRAATHPPVGAHQCHAVPAVVDRGEKMAMEWTSPCGDLPMASARAVAAGFAKVPALVVALY